MNQSILFSDVLNWDATSQAVVFSAQQGGALIKCYVTSTRLQALVSNTITDQVSAFEAFKHAQFDIEEIAEQMIEDEEFDAQGRIVID